MINNEIDKSLRLFNDDTEEEESRKQSLGCLNVTSFSFAKQTPIEVQKILNKVPAFQFQAATGECGGSPSKQAITASYEPIQYEEPAAEMNDDGSHSLVPQSRPSGAQQFVQDMYLKSIGKHMDKILDSIGKHEGSMLQKRKKLTVCEPFDLHTSKRAKLNDENQFIEKEPEAEYKPLWKEVQDSFQLRADGETGGTQSCKKSLGMTKPVAPKLATEQRSNIKSHFQSLVGGGDPDLEEDDPSQFKARKLNKKILEGKSHLPEVEKRDVTFFEEFHLSRSNTTAVKEEASREPFKALELNSKILKQKTFEPKLEARKTIQPSPFKLQTEERIKPKEQVEPEAPAFKAREMPRYSFFTPKKAQAVATPKKGFNLRTAERSMSARKYTSLAASAQKQEDHQFRAKPMPDFSGFHSSSLLPNAAAPKELTIQQPFSLSTMDRGAEKQAAIEKQLELEKAELKRMSVFKAKAAPKLTPVKRMASVSAAKRSTIGAAPMLSSDIRAKQRAEFDEKVRLEREKLVQQEEEQRKQQEEEEAEEVKKLRAMSKFKATPVKHYKNIEGNVTPKKLTAPKMPRLETSRRSEMKN